MKIQFAVTTAKDFIILRAVDLVEHNLMYLLMTKILPGTVNLVSMNAVINVKLSSEEVEKSNVTCVLNHTI